MTLKRGLHVTLRRAAWIPYVLALAGSALLLYWNATARPLWVDEEMLLLNVRDRGFLELAGPLWLDQTAPLGWLVLERFLLLTLGRGEPALRLLPAAFGIATLVTAAWIGRRWMGVAGAATFVALCATGEWIVFFTLELKHYSADLFGALLIPALAAWAVENDERFPDRSRRIMRWWIAAAVAQWISNGALFVTPLCAAVVGIAVGRTRNRRAIAAMVMGGALWTASFAANYALVLRHASTNAYLREYWAFAFPPVAEGTAATLTWLGHWMSGFAVKPVGTGLPLLLWLAWAVGIAYAAFTRRTHGLMIATVPLAALALALLHVIPPFERIALWVVPSMYAGVAYCADASLAPFGVTSAPGRPRALAVSAVAAMIAFAVSGDIVWHGLRALGHRPQHSNYGLDDRRSIRFLLANHRPGDAILTTHFGLAGLWWYGAISVAAADRGGRLPDGSPIFEIRHLPAEQCDQPRMVAALGDQPRAAVYLAFRMNVEPVGFDELVLREAGERWALDTYKDYAELSRVAIFDLHRTPDVATAGALAEPRDAVPQGCVGIRPAQRW
jgi:hypothetical protein